jgi:hypothetical protein
LVEKGEKGEKGEKDMRWVGMEFLPMRVNGVWLGPGD